MRSTFCGTMTLIVLWSCICVSQTASPAQPRSDSSTRSQARMSPLVARSEMQRPKPLPTVRPLRFQEIPVNAQGLRSEDKATAPDNMNVQILEQVESEQSTASPLAVNEGR